MLSYRGRIVYRLQRCAPPTAVSAGCRDTIPRHVAVRHHPGETKGVRVVRVEADRKREYRTGPQGHLEWGSGRRQGEFFDRIGIPIEHVRCGKMPRLMQ